MFDEIDDVLDEGADDNGRIGATFLEMTLMNGDTRCGCKGKRK